MSSRALSTSSPSFIARAGRRALLEIFALALLAAAAACTAEPAAPGPTALFELAELEPAGAELAAALVDGLPLHAGALPEASRARLERAVREVATPANARAAQLTAFSEAWDAERAAAVTAWYHSETGARLLAMESAAARADWEQELSPFIDEMMGAEPASLRRIKLLQRIERATRLAEDSAANQSGVDRILTLAVWGLTPEAERPSEPSVEAGLEQRRAAALAGMRMQMSVIMQFVYRDANEDELALQADFVESDAGQWLLAANRTGMAATLDRLGSELRKRLLAQSEE